MRVPIRKGGKYTYTKPDPNITQDKFIELENELQSLKKNQIQAIQEVKRLGEMGDFSENAAYQIAKGRLRGINQRILDIEDHLKIAKIIKPPNAFNTVQLGHRVTIEYAGKQKTFLILGSSETNPDKGIISNHSPLGTALLGHKIGDTVKVRITDKENEYKIIKIF